MKITITADGRNLSATTNGQPLTSGSVGIEAAFVLSADYDGLAVTAVFSTEATRVDVLLTKPCCVVPWEVLQEPRATLFVGVVGKNGSGEIVIPTIWGRIGMIECGTVAEGIDPQDPTPDIAAQLLQIAQDTVARAETAETTATEAAEAAGESATAAGEAKTDAETAAQAAEAAKAEAEAAQAAAEVAQAKAEDAQGAAETAQAAAEVAQGKAEDAQGAAEVAQGKAEDAQGAAETAQQAAETARDAASSSATGASGSATTAAQQAQEAADSAATALTRMNSANSSAQAAANSASSAEAAKTAAEAAQTAAQAAQNEAEYARSDAIAAANAAGGYSSQARQAIGQAQSAMNAAQRAADSATASAAAASNSATAAANSATAAGNAQAAAETAQAAAETAQGLAEDAQEAAEQAQSDAETAAQSVSQSAAQISQNASDIGDLKSAVKKKAPVIIDTASGAIASFEDGADGMPIKALTVNIEPAQSGSGDPSPTNVRPISGWTGCNVTRTGKNLLDINAVTSGAVDHDTGAINPNTGNKVTPLIRCEPNTTYVVSGFERSIRPKYYKSTIEYIGEAASTTSSTFTTPADCHFMRIQGVNAAWNSAVSPQLELGAIATAYEPYQSETYHITFPAEAGTVYGGTLDVTAGVLTVDRANIASYSGETLPGKWISDRDVYAAGTIPTTGAQVVYELATPIEITLTPTQIDTLLGTNNIWADCGPVSVDYPADTKLYIQKINAPTDDDMIADTQIDSGKYFLINNSLYLSTTVIPAGDTIIPGTNCTKTNLAAALNALNT